MHLAGQARKESGMADEMKKSAEVLAKALTGGRLIRVVKCKDCMYWGTKVITQDGRHGDCLNFFGHTTPSDFYCKWGTRG